MATYHDELMKELIAAFPKDFLRLAAPRIAERIDLDAVVFGPEEHYPGGPTGREQRPDLIARATPRSSPDGDALLHVEIELEHRLRVEPKLMRYNRGLSLKYALPVHTMVLYLRGGPAGSRSRRYEERSMGLAVGTLHYHSLGLSQAPAAGYLARAEPLAWALAALMRLGKGQSRSELGLACLCQIARATGLSDQERLLLSRCVFMYIRLESQEAREFDKILAELDDEEVQVMKMSMAEWWQKEGMEKGLQKGREEGLEKGLEKGRESIRDLVLRLLGQRFGSLSSEVQRQVAAIASADELSRLAERVYQVESLEELGLA